MKINRNNYEEYFLLYADNELSQAEKNEVEIFVKQNVDLEEEFNMIKLTINIPDEMVSMPDKLLLIKNASLSFINENNYEEIFVLYHDNELTNEQKNETEDFLKINPQFATEFELIRQSKLSPEENIVYPGKKQLYKKEKVGRIIPLIFWRSLAAAIFIGFGLWIALSYFNQQKSTRTMALNENVKSLPAPVVHNGIVEKHTNKEKVDATSLTIKEQNGNEKNDNNLKEEQKNIISRRNESRNVIVKAEVKEKILPEENAIQIKPDNRLEMTAVTEPINNEPDKIERTKIKIPTNDIVQHAGTIGQNQPAMQAQNASYIADNANDENYVFYNVKSDEFNKTKVGGFLKKVKRIVERNNPITRLIGGEDRQVASKL
ncbi:MAG TPA: hypothetical protein VIL78_21460 [Hanamia sp.]